MKKNLLKIDNFLWIGLLLLVFLPKTIFSASINVSSIDMVSAGDTTILEVYLDTEGQVINSIDGSISLSDEHNGNFEIRDLNLVNSAFSMWPRKPSAEEGHKISFIGGVPGGISGNRVSLFKIIVKINESGNFSITPNKVTIYLNDGLATALDITKNVSIIKINEKKTEIKDKWEEVISNDNNAPMPFNIELLQDVNIYDGKKFISFEAIDIESGISHYEVREGNYPAVRTGNSYVLIDQINDTDLTVTAYDNAGNFQVSNLKQKDPINWLGIFVVIIIVLLLKKVIKRIRKGKNKVNVQ